MTDRWPVFGVNEAACRLVVIEAHDPACCVVLAEGVGVSERVSNDQMVAVGHHGVLHCAGSRLEQRQSTDELAVVLPKDKEVYLLGSIVDDGNEPVSHERRRRTAAVVQVTRLDRPVVLVDEMAVRVGGFPGGVELDSLLLVVETELVEREVGDDVDPIGTHRERILDLLIGVRLLLDSPASLRTNRCKVGCVTSLFGLRHTLD